jgi:hypothetical protein
MSRPNAFGVIERVLSLHDKLTEAHLEVYAKCETIRTLQERVRKLEAEVQDYDKILQQTCHERFQLVEKHEMQLARIQEAHPEVVIE